MVIKKEDTTLTLRPEFDCTQCKAEFARLVIPSIPMNLDLKNNDYLRGLDEREVRSLNGLMIGTNASGTGVIFSIAPSEAILSRTGGNSAKKSSNRSDFCPPRHSIYPDESGFEE
jgi:hypothetical protein